MEYITIFVDDKDKHNIFSTKDIAFYPKEGFMIFEGYCLIKTSNLPIIIEVYKEHPQYHIINYYKLEITNILRKDLQLNADKICKKCDLELDLDSNSEENLNCDCNICYYPTEIFIVEFSVLEECSPIFNSELQSKIVWDYCIDNRYSSPKLLLSTYKALLDLPEDKYKPYRQRRKDRDFYIGYYKIRKLGKNKYEVSDAILEEFRDELQKDRKIIENTGRELKELTKIEMILKECI